MNAITGMAQPAATVSSAWTAAVERQERPDGADTVKEKGASELSGHAAPKTDLYVHGEEAVCAGLYRLTKDENGAPKIIFDAPGHNAAEAADGEDDIVKSLEQPLEEKEASGEDEDKKGDGITIMETTGNCDKVEAEIRKLMQEKARLSRQMNRCADHPDKQQEVQNRLQQVENELRVKDTDEYRKQHMVITSQRIVKAPNE